MIMIIGFVALHTLVMNFAQPVLYAYSDFTLAEQFFQLPELSSSLSQSTSASTQVYWLLALGLLSNVGITPVLGALCLNCLGFIVVGACSLQHFSPKNLQSGALVLIPLSVFAAFGLPAALGLSVGLQLGLYALGFWLCARDDKWSYGWLATLCVILALGSLESLVLSGWFLVFKTVQAIRIDRLRILILGLLLWFIVVCPILYWRTHGTIYAFTWSRLIDPQLVGYDALVWWLLLALTLSLVGRDLKIHLLLPCLILSVLNVWTEDNILHSTDFQVLLYISLLWVFLSSIRLVVPLLHALIRWPKMVVLSFCSLLLWQSPLSVNVANIQSSAQLNQAFAPDFRLVYARYLKQVLQLDQSVIITTAADQFHHASELPTIDAGQRVLPTAAQAEPWPLFVLDASALMQFKSDHHTSENQTILPLTLEAFQAAVRLDRLYRDEQITPLGSSFEYLLKQASNYDFYYVRPSQAAVLDHGLPGALVAMYQNTPVYPDMVEALYRSVEQSSAYWRVF